MAVVNVVELLRERRVLLAAGRHPLPTIADAVAGEPVRGNWWSHPKGGAIFAALQALDDEPEARVCRLVGGRVTFVHAGVWPAVLRFAGDGPRVRAAMREVPAAARRLYEQVESAGREGLRTDGFGHDVRTARRALELKLLVQTGEVHTESGKHAAVLTAWDHVGSQREKRAAASHSLEEAIDEVLEALVVSSGGATRKELRKWLPLPPIEIDCACNRLVAQGRASEANESLSSRSSATG